MLNKNLLSKFKFFSDIPEDKLSAIAQIGNLLEYKIDYILFRDCLLSYVRPNTPSPRRRARRRSTWPCWQTRSDLATR